MSALLPAVTPSLPWLLLALVAFGTGAWLVRVGKKLAFALILFGFATPAAVSALFMEGAGKAVAALSGVDFAGGIGLYGVMPLLLGGGVRPLQTLTCFASRRASKVVRTRSKKESDLNLLKHWTIYLLGAALAWAVYTALLFASGLAVRAILGVLGIASAQTPAAQILSTTAEAAASVPFAVTLAAALVFAFSFIRWPTDNPAISAQLESERKA